MQLEKRGPRTEPEEVMIEASRREISKEEGLARQVRGGGQCHPLAKERNRCQERKTVGEKEQLGPDGNLCKWQTQT